MDIGRCGGVAAPPDGARVFGPGAAGARCRSVERSSKRVDQVARSTKQGIAAAAAQGSRSIAILVPPTAANSRLQENASKYGSDRIL